MVESEPALAIQFLALHYKQVHGLVSELRRGKGDTNTEATDTTTSYTLQRDPSTLATTPVTDMSTTKDVTISQDQQLGLPTPNTTPYTTSSKDNSSNQQRRARGMKGQTSSTTEEMEDTASSKTLLNFGRLLNLYQSSPTPPLLTCPWSRCTFMTQGVGVEEGRPVGAEPDIAIQLLRLHVEYDHSETDPEFLSFLLLEKILYALPRPPPSIPPPTVLSYPC